MTGSHADDGVNGGDDGSGETGASGDGENGGNGESGTEGAGGDRDAPAGPAWRTYDRIAEEFAATRPHPWPEVTEFLAGRAGARGLDVGCGNGRHLDALADRVDRAVGVDASRELLAVAARNVGGRDRVGLVRGDAAALPLAAGTVDVGLYVATVHHLPTRAARVASLDELARVLTPDGVALVSAWSTVHDRFDREEGFDTTVDWTLPDGSRVPRFYHVYDPAEFRADVADSRLRLAGFDLSSGNCYATVRPGGRGEP